MRGINAFFCIVACSAMTTKPVQLRMGGRKSKAVGATANNNVHGWMNGWMDGWMDECM